VVAIFLDAIRAGRPITIFGSGNQVRDFLYVSDAVSGVLAVAAAGRNGTWNVGTGVATSINALLGHLESALGPVAGVSRVQPRPGDIESSRLVVERIRSELGWASLVSLPAGIREVAARPGRRVPREVARPSSHFGGTLPRTRPREPVGAWPP
jgi:UDP-glucose 4-epimerase